MSRRLLRGMVILGQKNSTYPKKIKNFLFSDEKCAKDTENRKFVSFWRFITNKRKFYAQKSKIKSKR